MCSTLRDTRKKHLAVITRLIAPTSFIPYDLQVGVDTDISYHHSLPR